jgi:hypothetical protein
MLTIRGREGRAGVGNDNIMIAEGEGRGLGPVFILSKFGIHFNLNNSRRIDFFCVRV